MLSRIGTSSIALCALLVAASACNEVLGIHEAADQEWDGSRAPTEDPSSSNTSGATSGVTASTRSSSPFTIDAGAAPPPTNVPTTKHPWATWPMPNPPSTNLPNPQSYFVSVDGVVLDNETNLTWQQTPSEQTYSWTDAITYCSSLPLSNGGWRLPSRIELLSLIDFTQIPTIDSSTFPGTPMGYFWSGSLVAGNASYAWAVNFGFTVTPVYDNPLNATFYVRCVR